MPDHEPENAATPDVSVVVPVYRSAETLPALVERLVKVFDERGEGLEILCVDDGSPDDSWPVLLKLRERFPEQLVLIQLMRNYGQHNALMCGFRHARGRVIVTMDADLQHPPEEVPRLLEALRDRDLDLVYGGYDTRRHPLVRRIGSGIILAFVHTVFRVDHAMTSFRAIRRELVQCIFAYDLNFTFIDGLLFWNTQRVGSVPVSHHPRAGGQSSYSPRKLLAHALDIVTNFSLLPLKFTAGVGMLVALAGFAFALFHLVRTLLADLAWPGYASTIIIILVLGGLQLIALGVLGEYLGRMHLNVNRKPQYRERQVLEATGAKRQADGTP